MEGKRWLWGGVVVIIGLVLVVIKSFSTRSNNDYKMAIIENDGIMIRSVSWQRGMVNELWIDGKVSVWVPEGMGWYQSDKIGKLLAQEKKEYLASEIMFYNFGFIPDVVIFGNGGGWLSNVSTIKSWGIVNYGRFLLLKPRLMVKQEIVNTNLRAEEDYLNEVIQRDFADSRVLEEDLRLTIYNVGQSQGLANFMSRILGWSGFGVVGVDNYNGEINGNCKIDYGSRADSTYGFGIIKKEFRSCSYYKNEQLDPMTVELYFGDSYSQMLNYPSYIND